MTQDSITIIRPDDWHIHFRDNEALKLTVPDTSRCYGRAIIMPNLTPPVTTSELAKAYKDRIDAQVPSGESFEPLMTLYLTDNMDPNEIRKGKDSGVVTACKLYPAGATTNSDSGVTDIKHIYPVLEVMQETGMLLLVHGEVTDCSIDIFDREKVFIDRHMTRILVDFPELKVVFEHITTADAVDFVENGPDRLAATITAHHLLYERNHMLAGGIRPHYYCLPILKRRTHQEELVRVATSGNSKFFLGSDSAPHPKGAKESSCGCAGCYTGHASIELYAEVFDKENALDNLEAFASLNGPAFYGLPVNTDSITLTRQSWSGPSELEFNGEVVVPLRAGEDISWKITG